MFQLSVQSNVKCLLTFLKFLVLVEPELGNIFAYISYSKYSVRNWKCNSENLTKYNIQTITWSSQVFDFQYTEYTQNDINKHQLLYSFDPKLLLCVEYTL